MRVEWNKVIRYLAYTLELLVLFMLQETPGLLPPLFGARPVLLFPAVITIAMFETEIPALPLGWWAAFSVISASPAPWASRPGAGGALLFYQPAGAGVLAEQHRHGPSHGDCGHRPDGVLAVVLPVLLPVLPPQLRLYQHAI